MAETPPKNGSLFSYRVTYYPNGKRASYELTIGGTAVAVIVLLTQLLVGWKSGIGALAEIIRKHWP